MIQSVCLHQCTGFVNSKATGAGTGFIDFKTTVPVIRICYPIPNSWTTSALVHDPNLFPAFPQLIKIKQGKKTCL